jgi:predicted TIM-barrel fold metal-dependent hydrolase
MNITSPGAHLTPGDDEQAVGMTRQTNEELAGICAAHPTEFRFSASLPLPCINESIDEIKYALETLGAVGFTVMPNSDGVYLGDPSLDQVFAELSRHHATVFIHPTSCTILNHGCGSGMITVNPFDHVPLPMMGVRLRSDSRRI